jgi:hypothetical protein
MRLLRICILVATLSQGWIEAGAWEYPEVRRNESHFDDYFGTKVDRHCISYQKRSHCRNISLTAKHRQNTSNMDESAKAF